MNYFSKSPGGFQRVGQVWLELNCVIHSCILSQFVRSLHFKIVKYGCWYNVAICILILGAPKARAKFSYIFVDINDFWNRYDWCKYMIAYFSLASDFILYSPKLFRPNFILAILASDFQVVLAKWKFYSPWRVGECLCRTLSVYTLS